MKKGDLPHEAIEILVRIRRLNDEEGKIGVPAPESQLLKELADSGLVERVSEPLSNERGNALIIGHRITEKGRKLLGGGEV